MDETQNITLNENKNINSSILYIECYIYFLESFKINFIKI